MALGHRIITGHLPKTGQTGVGRLRLHKYSLGEAELASRQA